MSARRAWCRDLAHGSAQRLGRQLHLYPHSRLLSRREIIVDLEPAHQCMNISGTLSRAGDLYRQELLFAPESAFVTHGLATWVVLFGSWVLFCTLIDLASTVPWVKGTKLQSDVETADTGIRAKARQLVAARWAEVFVETLVFAPLLKAAFPLGHWKVALSWAQLCSFFAVWFVTNDLLFTLAHRCFHEYPSLYRVAHKQHHMFTAPFAWMSHAMSSIEATANGLAVMFYPVVHAIVLGRPTPLELVWICQVVAQLIGCIEHSGYDGLPPLLLINPAKFPSWMFSTTRHHDDHHRLFKGNYGGYLAVWDVLMGTKISLRDSQPVAQKVRLRNSRKTR